MPEDQRRERGGAIAAIEQLRTSMIGAARARETVRETIRQSRALVARSRALTRRLNETIGETKRLKGAADDEPGGSAKGR